MSQNKIDSRKVISKIFDEEKRSSQDSSQSPVTSFVKGSRSPKLSLFSQFNRLVVFGANEFAGIDLGTDSVKVVLLSQDRRGLHIKDLFIEKLVRSRAQEKTEVADEEKIAVLSKVTARIQSKWRAAISLNDPSLYLDVVKVPLSTQDEERDWVRREISEKHLIDSENSFFDFTSLEHTGGGKSSVDELLVVAAPKALVYRHFEMVQSAGFKVIAVEPNMLALYEAVQRIKPWHANEKMVILDVGHRFSNLMFCYGGKLLLSRTIPLAGEKLTQAIANQFGCSFEKAEQLKMQYGLNGLTDIHVKPENREEAGRVSQILSQELERLLSEIERSLQFAGAKEAAEQENIRGNRLLLFGGSSRLKGLSALVEKKLELTCETIDLWQGLASNDMRIGQEILNEEQALFGTSLGLALRINEWKILPFGLGMPG